MVYLCGSLNSYSAIDSYMSAWLIGNGTIRRSGLFGAGVALLEEVCHFEDSSYAQYTVVSAACR